MPASSSCVTFRQPTFIDSWRDVLRDNALAGMAEPKRYEKRDTFLIPDGYEPVRDNEGRATGELKKIGYFAQFEKKGYVD